MLTTINNRTSDELGYDIASAHIVMLTAMLTVVAEKPLATCTRFRGL